ncbi:MAG: thiamine phosphate synthase [Acidobacteriaceae bacterium]
MTKPGHQQSIRQKFPPLYPILDADLVLRGTVAERNKRHDFLRRLVRDLAEAGVEILQYRNKRDEDAMVAEDAKAIREAAGAMQLILNDRAPLVTATGWDGLHIGQDDLPSQQARQLVGPASIVGLSTHNEEQVIAASAQPVDYIAIGPVFATASKSDTSPIIGLEGVRRARGLTQKPLVAIGGITLTTAASVYDAGADSLAIISAIFVAPHRSPAQSAKDILDIFK